MNMGASFDAGKAVEVGAPIHDGDRLVARSYIHDIFEKTGRSGGMLFIVHRMAFTNQDDVKVATVDWRMVVRLGMVEGKKAKDDPSDQKPGKK